MVRQMISLEPSSRPSFEQILSTNRGSTLPELFYSFFHEYNVFLQDVPSPATFLRPYSPMDEELAVGIDNELPSDSDRRIGKIKHDVNKIKTQLDQHDALQGGKGEDALLDGSFLLAS